MRTDLHAQSLADIAEKVAVVGVGYVGLPLAVALSQAGTPVIGYDTDKNRVTQLSDGVDATGAFTKDELADAAVEFRDDLESLSACTCFIITVPTPLAGRTSPDLGPLIRACREVARVLTPGDLVIIESTVYPGATREVCQKVISEESGLECGADFQLAYSPERVNPGDRERALDSITKLVAGHDPESTARAARLYRTVVSAGVHELPSLEAAELAKTVENAQRDLNIAFCNEVARICAALRLDTRTVLDACATKWNFQRFRPGMVGGHCIPVDPYYLIHRSELHGYRPDLLVSARRTNQAMPGFLAGRLVKRLAKLDIPLGRARVALLGATFKADVPDMRNSGVVELFKELESFGVRALVHDPLADREQMRDVFGDRSVSLSALRGLDMVILAVGHEEYRCNIGDIARGVLRPGGSFVDLSDSITPDEISREFSYGSI